MIHYRDMTMADIEAGLALCRASGWNQLSRDWELFLRLSPRGCRVAVKDGQVIGTVTTVRYENRFCWIGMVLVNPAERRQGIGTRLLHESLEVLKGEQSIRLDATPAGHAVYLKYDFVDEYWLSRMERIAIISPLMIENNQARPMMEADLPQVIEIDREIFGADRGAMLAWMLEGAPEYAWVMAYGNRIEGYTFGRHGFKFEHVGPLIAQDRKTARALVTACLSGYEGRSFIIDASLHDSEWKSELESLGFKEQRPFIRMFHGVNLFPGLPEKQYAILGPEFG
jgi:GNAT superfamily N-acetyltransferase